MSFDATVIWPYLIELLERLWMCGIEYQYSCTVRCPIITIWATIVVAFGNMWSGDAHGSRDGRIVPSLSISTNSALAAECLLGNSLPGPTVIGGRSINENVVSNIVCC